ncbi:MAG: hypothetical protein HON04_06225 [Planctomicrobium sp.]|nr:hypothetical protein [Planctomicrobium sp.]
MEPKQSFLLSIMLPLIPAAIIAFIFKIRWIFLFASAGSIVGQLFSSPSVTANFGPEATERDRIIAHALFDLPATLTCAFIGGVIGYYLERKHFPQRPFKEG